MIQGQMNPIYKAARDFFLVHLSVIHRQMPAFCNYNTASNATASFNIYIYFYISF